MYSPHTHIKITKQAMNKVVICGDNSLDSLIINSTYNSLVFCVCVNFFCPLHVILIYQFFYYGLMHMMNEFFVFFVYFQTIMCSDIDCAMKTE